MFGIGLPEMIVILAVALIVVGPEKLPDMARTVAKWVFELKKTVNQVKQSLEDEENLLGSVHSDLKKTGDELKENLLESDHFTFHEPGGPMNFKSEASDDIIDIDDEREESLADDDIYAQDSPDSNSGESEPDPENKIS